MGVSLDGALPPYMQGAAGILEYVNGLLEECQADDAPDVFMRALTQAKAPLMLHHLSRADPSPEVDYLRGRVHFALGQAYSSGGNDQEAFEAYFTASGHFIQAASSLDGVVRSNFQENGEVDFIDDEDGVLWASAMLMAGKACMEAFYSDHPQQGLMYQALTVFDGILRLKPIPAPLAYAALLSAGNCCAEIGETASAREYYGLIVNDDVFEPEQQETARINLDGLPQNPNS